MSQRGAISPLLNWFPNVRAGLGHSLSISILYSILSIFNTLPYTDIHTPFYTHNHLVSNWLEHGLLCFGVQLMPLVFCILFYFFMFTTPMWSSWTRFLHRVFRAQEARGSKGFENVRDCIAHHKDVRNTIGDSDCCGYVTITDLDWGVGAGDFRVLLHC